MVMPTKSGVERASILTEVLNPDRLPTPPAVALQVVNVASRPDCTPADLVKLLGRDPALCAKLLKAVNSCLYGLSKPVASIDRAIVFLGLATVRSLALGLSLPAMRPGAGPDPRTKSYWLESVGGAILARELAVKSRIAGAEDTLVAGLLRDLGAILLARAYPERWAASQAAATADGDASAAETAEFGLDHAEVSAELLLRWNLPADIVEPIRHHHAPERLVAAPKTIADRANLLYLASQLVHLDAVAQNPAWLDRVLQFARDHFGFRLPELIAFLEAVVPKVDEFAHVINQDIGQLPDFAGILTRGSQELVELTVERSRTQISGSVSMSMTRRRTGVAEHTPAPRSTLWTSPRRPDLPPPAPHSSPDLAPGEVLGDYRLVKLLGRGAMGLVYKAYEPSLDREVAVKLLAPDLACSAEARGQFAREAKVAAAIRHDNVVGIYAVREHGGMSYLAMEYVDGGSLQDKLDAGTPVPLPAVARAAREVAAGLAAAHTRGIVHRDIKPANLLVDAASGRVKITDFGLARVVDDLFASREGALKGTPLFMAPEHILGEPATHQSDLFSLGAVLYTLVTGRTPFSGDSIPAVLRSVTETDPAPPRELRADVPDWLDSVIMRLLAKRPAHRFASADDLLAALPEAALRA
jgi:HD-like signal output (HDOD) protein/predicted Ser/Thr protein kinase